MWVMKEFIAYDIYIGNGSFIEQADDCYHEVQHAYMFARTGADGKGNFGIVPDNGRLHHEWMLRHKYFNAHRNYLLRVGAGKLFIKKKVSNIMGSAGIDYDKITRSQYSKYVDEVAEILRIREKHMITPKK